jgi:hypothetical protein
MLSSDNAKKILNNVESSSDNKTVKVKKIHKEQKPSLINEGFCVSVILLNTLKFIPIIPTVIPRTDFLCS